VTHVCRSERRCGVLAVYGIDLVLHAPAVLSPGRCLTCIFAFTLLTIISFISGNLAHRTQKKIDRQNRTNITNRHTHIKIQKKDKRIV